MSAKLSLPEPTGWSLVLQYHLMISQCRENIKCNFRLTTSTIEPVSFSVPRVKTSHFQDDLFPPTRVLWRPAMLGKDWLAGRTRSARWVSLKPNDLPALSTTDSSKAPAKSAGVGTKAALGAVEKEKMLTSAVSDILETSEELEQDKMEGVGEEEWD